MSGSEEYPTFSAVTRCWASESHHEQSCEPGQFVLAFSSYGNQERLSACIVCCLHAMSEELSARRW